MPARTSRRRGDGLAALLAVLLAASGSPGARDGATAPARAGLTGRWTLDPERSDDAAERVRRAMPGTHVTDRAPGRPEPSGAGIDVTTPGVPGVGLAPGSGPARRGVPRALVELALESPAEITIAERDTLVLIEEKGGRVRAVRPDGQTYETGGTRTRARWAEGALVVDNWPDGAAKVRRTYAIEPEGSLLIVTLEIVAPQILPLTVKRLYTRSAPDGRANARPEVR